MTVMCPTCCIAKCTVYHAELVADGGIRGKQWYVCTHGHKFQAFVVTVEVMEELLKIKEQHDQILKALNVTQGER